MVSGVGGILGILTVLFSAIGMPINSRLNMAKDIKDMYWIWNGEKLSKYNMNLSDFFNFSNRTIHSRGSKLVNENFTLVNIV